MEQTKNEEEQMKTNIRENHSITKFFQPVNLPFTEHSATDESLLSMEIAIDSEDDIGSQSDENEDQDIAVIDANDEDRLVQILNDVESAMTGLKVGNSAKKTEKGLEMRYLAVKLYLMNMINHHLSKMKASVLAANALFKQGQTLKERSYITTAIRRWAVEFCVCGAISQSKQGHHTKHVSVLAQEDVKLKCIEWLSDRDALKRELMDLKNYINNEIVPEFAPTGTCGTVSLPTLRTYMHQWGYRFRKNTKGIYFDGHERPDVVEYRQKWSRYMMIMNKGMEDYHGDDMEIAVRPNLTSPTTGVQISKQV
jgi:hypothetical protein